MGVVEKGVEGGGETRSRPKGKHCRRLKRSRVCCHELKTLNVGSRRSYLSLFNHMVRKDNGR